MKRIVFWGSASLSVVLAIGACNSDPVPDDMGSGGSESESGGRRNSGGAKSSGGSASGGRSSGGRASGGDTQETGGSAPSGGMGGGMGGDMGGFGGDMGGASGTVAEACAASCAVSTTIGCEGNEDPVACEQSCVAGADAVPDCEDEYTANKACEGNDEPSGFQCSGPFEGVYYVAPSGSSACEDEYYELYYCTVQ